MEAVAELDALARDDNKAKQRGLYTDYSADGTLSSPADVTEEQARAMVAVVEDVLDNAGFLVDLITAMWRSNNVPPPVRAFLQQAADAVQTGGDAMETLMRNELQNMGRLAGLRKDAPEGMRSLRDVVRKPGET